MQLVKESCEIGQDPASVTNILQKNNLNYLGNQSKLYLYGHPSITFTDNRKIILSTIKYIKATLRFSS